MIKLRILALVCLISVSSVSLCWSSDAVKVLIDDPITLDERYGWIWSAEKDQKKLHFILDTGASIHVMTKAAANGLGLSCKNTPGYLYTGDGTQAPRVWSLI